MIESVLEFQDYLGGNCLIHLFQIAYAFRRDSWCDPSGPMLSDIEESCLYFVRKIKEFKLDSRKLLNHTTKYGGNFFTAASMFSETITRYLLTEKDVWVNAIDHQYLTPSLGVRLTIDYSRNRLLDSSRLAQDFSNGPSKLLDQYRLLYSLQKFWALFCS